MRSRSAWPFVAPTANNLTQGFRFSGTAVLAALAAGWLSVCSAETKPAAPAKVSFDKQVRPILQANCLGCHQPAKRGGDYDLSSFAKLMEPGSTGKSPIIGGKPAESHLLAEITPVGGKAKMPKGKPPLSAAELDLIRRWVAEGAVNDSPASTTARYDGDHPPSYRRPPIITSLDFSPDGKLLAISGSHETLVWGADGSKRLARLVGLSERIESVRFSPDGKSLAVAGGSPARMGEIQIWNVENFKLRLSVAVTYDTLYGLAWNPEGTAVSFGGGDNSVRAIDAKTGEQIFFQGAHNDWVFDTTFTKDGKHQISTGRDRSVKLSEFATQRFIDNITSITPGALKGGVHAAARHPQRDELIVGGSDGVPRVYNVFRVTDRKIGDDANLLRQLEPMPGRVFSVAYSRSGKRIVAGSSDGASGVVQVWQRDAEELKIPDDVRAIEGKTVFERSPTENKRLDDFRRQQDTKLLSRKEFKGAPIFATALSPDGNTVAASGADGMIRLLDAVKGTTVREFVPVPLEKPAATAAVGQGGQLKDPVDTLETEKTPDAKGLASISIAPASLRLTGRFDYAQVIVTGRYENGDTVDLTRLAEASVAGGVAELSNSGLLRGRADGKGSLQVKFGGKSASAPIDVSDLTREFKADWVRDVNPVLSKLGCNAGTCHGAKDGKNGFKLSLRGYDPLYDTAAFTDELKSRRTNVAAAEESLMLLKASGAVPHVGGRLTGPGEFHYEIIRNWIAGGAVLDPAAKKVVKIDLEPSNPVIQRIGDRQQLRVVATYADGKTRDVTREAFLESGNTEVASASRIGLMTSLRRGEAPVLARFEGAYAATTLTVMGDRTGFVWKQPESWGKIDDLVAEKWKRMKIEPSGLCTDSEFLRRVHLDLTGLPPSADEVRKFLADARPTRAKRDEVIDRLIGSPAFLEHWTNKWADLLQVNSKFLGREGATALRQWIRSELAANTPYDQFVRKILVASGSNMDQPAASYFKILRDPATTMENTTHLFLAVRFNCNKCHDHPFERWTQDQYYETAAYFARTELKADPRSAGRNIGGTAVEGGKPFYEIVADAKGGEIKHDRTQQVTPPKFPYPAKTATKPEASRREQMADWITSADNMYFARSYANRVWGYLTGVGLMEPLDDIRAGNPPTNPALMDHLTAEFLKSGFNVRELMRTVCKSRTYQLAITGNRWNDDDRINYSRAQARRLPAEVLYDAVYRVTGAVTKIPGVNPGTRAAELPDSEIDLPTGFLATTGRPVRESACECERSSGMQLGPVMALVSGATVSDAINDAGNEIAKLVRSQPDDRKLIEELFLRILNRPPTKEEVETAIALIPQITKDDGTLAEKLAAAEKAWEPARLTAEKARGTAIAGAKAALAPLEAKFAPGIAKRTAEREARLNKARETLASYDRDATVRSEEWARTYRSIEWKTLMPTGMLANNGAVLTRDKDGVITVTGPVSKVQYQLIAKLPQGITGLRLEALASDKLPSKGPGRSEAGNFVLTELRLSAAPAGNPFDQKPVKLVRAGADFNQGGYDVSTAIDGQFNEAENGWAIYGGTGANRVAVFQTKEPIRGAGGVLLTILMDQLFQDGKHSIGRFRLSYTTTPGPIYLNLPEDVKQILALESGKRSAEQKKRLADYHRDLDGARRELAAALTAAEAPVMIEPELTNARNALALAERPIEIDPKVRQLREDRGASQRQQQAARLTVAQDVTWALINSPAFLFNH